MQLYGGIEAGGTKIICAIGNKNFDIIEKISIPTATPTESIPKIIEFFKTFDIAALGVGSFGPIDPNPNSATYGYITNTPKLAWCNFNLIGTLKKAFTLPIKFDTDVNGAALAEHHLGHGRSLNNLLYVTVGTGIGVGALIHGQPVHGLTHPEMGHICIPTHPDDTKFKSHCPYHDHCWEGYTAGPAIKARWQMSTHSIPKDHPAWELTAHYISVGLSSLIVTYSPERIILGGGVMQQEGLFQKIHNKIPALLNGYVQHPAILENIQDYIVYPKLEQLAGTYGALLLAEQALTESK
ncbi:Putative fructokinase [Piscirickettsia salmonis]|uniref:fructokinase n=1 Tax=Piscirickettsia salmonis TaxID=1238 RepID=A0A1L6TD66_PISSA|nr:ROK family protein [Piscirickettsia salmonis]AKP74393.1 fructokinase [Piscirickettsia salmonis LF-89 = ATCC VR-1361]ALB23344.1 fructokinase [Piscirickettsia salmonis]ALY03240.1 fructokinase [Piscirickettsia salmonis]AMA42805.1 fructokinase [Piscirickettsia salmonis]AOS35274.1 fructokinase [Piscirickettsia salmonis]